MTRRSAGDWLGLGRFATGGSWASGPGVLTLLPVFSNDAFGRIGSVFILGIVSLENA